MKSFLVTFKDGPRTRWNADPDLVAHTLAQLCASAGRMHTSGEEPAVYISPHPLPPICLACKATLAVRAGLCLECLASTQRKHSDAYAPYVCRCEICQPH